MSAIRTTAAAALLGVSPNTLRSWERRFGYPSPGRSTGGHRQYELAEIEALRLAFEEVHNISSAVSLARERGEGPSSRSRLTRALRGFDEERANRLLEESLSVRSVERTIDELLLPAVEDVRGVTDDIPAGPEYELAWRHATGWLSAQRRLTPPAARDEGVLVFESSAACAEVAPGPAVEALHVQALEIALRRGGLRTLTLSVDSQPARLGRALRALNPTAVVFAGGPAPLEAVGRLVYTIRSWAGGELDVLGFRWALPDTGASTIPRLGPTSLAAREAMLARLRARAAGAVPPLGHVLACS